MSEKTYTLADLEQARKQGAEYERARCLREIVLSNKLPYYHDPIKQKAYSEGIRHAARTLESFGPIGETREETER